MQHVILCGENGRPLDVTEAAYAEVTLTDGATVALNSALGRVFRLTAAGNRSILAPTNPVQGRQITVIIQQDATGSRLVTFATGTGAFRFSGGLPFPTLTTTAGRKDKFVFQYDATDNRWDCLAAVLNFT